MGQISQSQVEEIAKVKMEDLNANDIESAKKIIEGTATPSCSSVPGSYRLTIG